MTPFLPSRLRLLTTAFVFAAAALPCMLFAQGDMESDWLPNTTLFFDELLPAHEAQDDLATHFDESEYIETFLVGQDELADFIRKAEAEGCGVDTKMYMWAISRGGF